MPLNTVSFVGTLAWDQSLAVTGFDAAEHVSSMRVSAKPARGASAANQVYPLQGTLDPLDTVTIDLFSLTSPMFGTALVPVRAYIMALKGAGAAWSYGPDAVNGWSGFLGGGGYIVGAAGDGFVFATTTAMTIDNGTKNVTISNLSSSATLTYTLGAVLGT